MLSQVISEAGADRYGVRAGAGAAATGAAGASGQGVSRPGAVGTTDPGSPALRHPVHAAAASTAPATSPQTDTLRGTIQLHSGFR